MARRPSSSRRFPWYDSVWLESYAAAYNTILRVRPAAIEEFAKAFDIFHTRPDFEVQRLPQVFDDGTLEEIRAIAGSLAATDLELHEAKTFKRFVVHDHPVFTGLQAGLVDLVSEAVGELVEPSYNFLSLYGAAGVCPPHLDAPAAKWTLDFCVDQSDKWPILISQVQPWLEPGDDLGLGDDWESQIKDDPGLRFTSYELSPGEAILFSGPSQWHFRDPMPPGPGRRFCDLLFFHFIPAGTRELVEPTNWAQLFDIPELAPASGA